MSRKSITAEAFGQAFVQVIGLMQNLIIQLEANLSERLELILMKQHHKINLPDTTSHCLLDFQVIRLQQHHLRSKV